MVSMVPVMARVSSVTCNVLCVWCGKLSFNTFVIFLVSFPMYVVLWPRVTVLFLWGWVFYVVVHSIFDVM
jgi:hypothetical protein